MRKPYREVGPISLSSPPGLLTQISRGDRCQGNADGGLRAPCCTVASSPSRNQEATADLSATTIPQIPQNLAPREILRRRLIDPAGSPSPSLAAYRQLDRGLFVCLIDQAIA
jgi:hypothetical protein